MRAFFAIASLVVACDGTLVTAPVMAPTSQVVPDGPPSPQSAMLPELHFYADNPKSRDLLDAYLHADGTLELRGSRDDPAGDLAAVGRLLADGSFTRTGSTGARPDAYRNRPAISFDTSGDRVVLALPGRSFTLRVEGADDDAARQLAIDVFAIAVAMWSAPHAHS